MERKQKNQRRYYMTTKTEEQKEMHRSFSASEKCRAVLTLWTEKKNSSAVCRELTIKWTQLNIWQNQALEGMFRALDTGQSTEKVMLGTRLERLLDRKTDPRPSRLEKRLDMITRKKGVQPESAPG
ncbi:MAG TPA: hypothetical protein DCZ94_19020 [Lentisphaeria bacterium]|nr:hypothetical protein [Lentisphaeria bacterium]